MGAQWLSGRELVLRSRGCGFKPSPTPLRCILWKDTVISDITEKKLKGTHQTNKSAAEFQKNVIFQLMFALSDSVL